MDNLKTKLNLKNIALGGVALLFTAALYFTATGAQQNEKQLSYVEIDGKKIEVELAQTPEEKIKGLSGRSSLSEGTGMLFTFDEKGRLTFWMKDMQFDLDFIWIADDTIVDTHKNVPAPKKGQTHLDTYSPSVPADKILEVGAGWITENFGNTDLRGGKINIFIQ
ncbi:MAG: DUF192 domain-containing protein [Candidatus Spechtbacterales bacterium]